MIRRWILRGLAVALLAVCVAAWVGSYWRIIGVGWYFGRDYYLTGMEWGRIAFRYEPSPEFVAPGGMLFQRAEDIWQRWDLRRPHHWLGFSYGTCSGLEVSIPFWFCSLLLGALLWLLWRRTRPKSIGRGFPVEVGERDKVTG
jgi:hypothetical protein